MTIISTIGSTIKSVSSLSMECKLVNPRKGIASTNNNISLHHTRHLSKIRLDSSLPHYPQIGKINAMCTLHRWLGHETEKDVYFSLLVTLIYVLDVTNFSYYS